MSISSRLAELGIELPAVPAPLAAYVPAARVDGQVRTSGQLPLVGGELAVRGKVGENVAPEKAKAHRARAWGRATDRGRATARSQELDRDRAKPQAQVRAKARRAMALQPPLQPMPSRRRRRPGLPRQTPAMTSPTPGGEQYRLSRQRRQQGTA